MKAIVIAILVSVFSSAAIGQDIKTEAWIEDFAQLKREMSEHYANLEWAVSERGVDLKQLSAETQAKISEAKSDAEARIAFENFLRAFGDGHLRIEWTVNSAPAEAQQSAAPLCQRLGYRSRQLRPGIDLVPLSGFRPIDARESRFIPAGIGVLSNGKRFGVVSIRLFDDSVYPELCQAAAAEMKLSPESACDQQCENQIRSKTANLYVAALASQVERLNREKIDLLVVDLTGNGGGSDVYQPMARTVTTVPLKTSKSGYVRHPHWIKQNKDRMADLEREMASSSGEMRKKLQLAVDAARQDITEAEKNCDLSPLWENRKPACSLVAAFADSPVRYAKPGELSNTSLGSIYFSASRYLYKEGIYKGKLAVLVDQRTASSSEAFAAMLRDNDAATIIGHPTAGAGCGYTNGGIPTTLKNSGARVRMPDCVRLRKDGANEINGIDPDVFVPWRPNDSHFQRAKRLATALSSIGR
jgi:hypothetical protein